MQFSILTALLLPILASALALPAPNGAALNVRQDEVYGDESDSSVCGLGISEEQCDACFNEDSNNSDCGY